MKSSLHSFASLRTIYTARWSSVTNKLRTLVLPSIQSIQACHFNGCHSILYRTDFPGLPSSRARPRRYARGGPEPLCLRAHATSKTTDAAARQRTNRDSGRGRGEEPPRRRRTPQRRNWSAAGLARVRSCGGRVASCRRWSRCERAFEVRALGWASSCRASSGLATTGQPSDAVTSNEKTNDRRYQAAVTPAPTSSWAPALTRSLAFPLAQVPVESRRP